MANKIKIVYLIDTFFLAGAEKLLLDICRKIDKERFEIYVSAVVCGGPLQKDFEQLGVKVKVFNKKSKINPGLIWQLYKYLKEVKPQIVHTHLFAADTWGRIAAYLAKTPLIISTEHNMNIDYGWLKKVIKLILSWPTSRIIAVSQGVKNYSVKNEKIKAAKIEVIYNGIDLAKFSFRGYRPIDLAEIKAVTIGRLEEQKGQRYLLAAMPEILAKYPGFKLEIIGKGGLAPQLQEQARQLNIKDKIIFSGEQPDIAVILRQKDLFILPSLWEGLGMVVLEAQAVGVPVLASKIPGLDEIIKDQETGWLFEPKEPRAIFEAVDRLLSSPDLQQKIAEQAYEQVKAKFSLEQMVSAYTNLYLSLIKND